MPGTNITCSASIKKRIVDALNLTYYDCPIGETQEIEFENLNTAEYEFVFKMSGKTDADTITDDGIEKTAEICIKNFKFDDYSIDKVMESLAVYTHDNNGYGEMHDEVFSYLLGCNGTVTLKFKTPVHLWLMETNE